MSTPTYVLLKPLIEAVGIAPNPVSANTAYLLQAIVTETEIILVPLVRYCGTFYCGEEGGIF